jgi:hypothetical protein
MDFKRVPLTVFARNRGIDTLGEAGEYASEAGHVLGHYNTPIEAAREGITADEAEEMAKADPSLVWVDTSAMVEWADSAVQGHVYACIGSDPDCDLFDDTRGFDDPTLGERSTWSGRDGIEVTDEEWRQLENAARRWRKANY